MKKKVEFTPGGGHVHQKMYQKSFQETLRNFRDEDRLCVCVGGGAKSQRRTKTINAGADKDGAIKKVEEGEEGGSGKQSRVFKEEVEGG